MSELGVLNYTTQIDATKTATEIQAMLARAGATRIGTEYNDGEVVGLAFEIETSPGVRTAFALPVDVDAMHQLLIQQDKAGKLSGSKLRKDQRSSREQAARVAWRVIKDWIEAQLAIVETQMVTLDQVMLPYVTTGPQRTLYDDYRASRAITTGGEP